MAVVVVTAIVLAAGGSAPAVAAPSVNLGIAFAPGSPAPPVLNQPYALALPVGNDGDVNLARMTLIVTLPVEMAVSSVMTGSYTALTDFAAGEGVRVSYEKNTAPGVFTLWGSSPNTSTSTSLTSPPPGLGAGEYLTRVRWEYGAAAPGMSPIVPARLSGRATNPDNAGFPVGPTDQIQTCATLSGETAAVPPETPAQNACRNFNLVTGPTAAIEAPDSTPLGSATHASVSLSGGAPTGTLTFSVYAADDGACATPLFEGDVAVNGAGSYTGPDYPATVAGAYKWVARYGGDAMHAPAATPCNTAAGAFAVVAPPSASASFTPATVTADESSTLTFTITNPPANTVPLTGVALTATLPAGLAVASPNGLEGSCGTGTIIAIPGSQSASLSGGSIPVDGSCSFSVDVTASAVGAFASTSAVQSANGGTGSAAPATLTVEKIDPPLTIESPDSTPLGTGSHATASLSGGDPSGTLTFSAFAADDSDCSTRLSSADVAVDGAGDYPSPDFTPDAAGAYQWVVSYGGDSLHAAAATACGDPDGALAVVAPPSASASFAPATVTAGESSTLTFTITNPPANTVPLTGIALEATLPAPLAVASPNGLDGSCGGGVITAVPGTHVVSLTGGTVPVDGTCTFSVDVTAPEPGKPTATTDAVQSANGGAGNTATAELVVRAPAATVPPPSPPPPPTSRPSAPEQPAEPAVSEVELLSRCVRRSRSGRVRLRLRMVLADPATLRIRFERGVGSKALRKCPTPGSGRPFAGRFKPVKTREEASPPLATTASLKHLVRLRLRLKPGLYRVTVWAVLDGGRLSSPQRVFLRVLRR
jgi:hypothetical protein